MRFIAMHKTNADNEAGVLPGMELITNMGKLMGEMAKGGILRAGEGLQASSKGVRLNFRGGSRTVTPGPFIGGNELLAGFAIVRVRSLDEAVEWATRFADVVGDVEIDVRPVMEAWDLGVMPKPPGAAMRYMIAHKATEQSEAGILPSSEQIAAMRKLTGEMSERGVLLTAMSFQPSSKGARLNYSGGKHTVTDGPFTESKELIAGFVLLELDTLEEMIAWIRRFAEIIGDVEVDIRTLHEPSDVGQDVAPALSEA